MAVELTNIHVQRKTFFLVVHYQERILSKMLFVQSSAGFTTPSMHRLAWDNQPFQP